MNERRKSRRIELESKLLIKRMDSDGGPKEVNIDVVDASKSGVGFLCPEKLEVGAVYESYLTIWTKEVLHAFLEIVRIVEKGNNTYEYGSIFIGMSEQDASRIAAYDTIDIMSE